MASFSHRMSWGTALQDGGVRFRLWAPSADAVGVVLEQDGAETERAMEPAGDGWWQLHVAEAGAGCRYRYRMDDGLEVPDPASRFQPDDCLGSSLVVDAGAYDWRVPHWQGRPWHEAVLYELHVGAFTPQGSYRAVIEKLDALVDLGVTAVELMPVADFPGERNWGYDGVLPFAPDSAYGTPDDLKALVDAAHERGLMIFLDVVYNHFGPEGNYLGQYAAPFFTDRHQTPWGDAVNFDTGWEKGWVRRFFIDNALYWLEEYRFDGLRLDAVHAIRDDSDEHVLTELARQVREGPGARRYVHLVLENDANECRWLGEAPSGGYRAQWNDDFHHALHVSLTGEADSYYGDYADHPVQRLSRTLAEGFDYQGEHSAHRGHSRGEPSGSLPPTAFVAFLQNHDQIGNRALGERVQELSSGPALRAATEILLLSPSPPLLFMGQEWCASSRFPYFCDYSGALADAVVQGRLREFAQFDAFRDPEARERIPDPVSPETYRAAKLSWEEREQGEHAAWWHLFKDLLELRRRHLMPLLDGLEDPSSERRMLSARAFQVTWRLAGGASYSLMANLSDGRLENVAESPGRRLYATPSSDGRAGDPGSLGPWSTVFILAGPDDPAGTLP